MNNTPPQTPRSEDITYCAYCGQAYPRGTPKFNNPALTAHIRVCPAHPMRKLEKLLHLASNALYNWPTDHPGRDDAMGLHEAIEQEIT